MGREPHPVTKQSKRKCKKESMNESLNPMLGDEPVGVGNFLAEPKSDHVSVDGILCFNEDNIPKCLELEDFSLGFEYGFKTNFGGLGSFNNPTEDELKFEVLDGLLDGVDEVDDFHASSYLASPCEDNFLLDIEYVGKVSGFECGPSDGSQLGNSTTESQSPGFSGSNNGTTGVSDSSMETIRELECINEMNQKTVFFDTDELLREEATFENKKCFNTLEDLDEEKPLMNFIMSRKPGKSHVQTIKRETPYKDKRLRKPSRRLIAEFSDKNSGASSQIPYESRPRRGPGRLKKNAPVLQLRESESDDELSPSESEDDHVKKKNFRGVRSQTLLESRPRRGPGRPRKSAPALWHDSDNEISAFESEDERVKKTNSICGPSSQTLSESQPRRGRGRPKKSAPVLQWHMSSSYEFSESESEDERLKIKKSHKSTDRRKNQRMWTLNEVTALVDGISQYGVSRWTDIKRRLFPTSSYRTPIDLRDKWRNLLRASCAVKQRSKEVEQKQKQATRPLPMSLLLQVRELATANPYPMVRNSKRSNLDHEASSSTPNVARNVRRKNKYT